jgi:hypothetical protein
MSMRIILASLLLLAAFPVAAQEAAAPAPAPATAPAPGTAEAEARADVRAAAFEAGEIAIAADEAFGSATEGMGKMIEKVFADLGKPNAYIVGREGGGAFLVGLRYGKGQLHSKIEGERTVYWTGPSFGPDVGGDASRTFTLVYNLDDTQDLFDRFPAVEGRAYLIGGVSANYHQKGNIILVPLRLGAGWRLGANVGYLKYAPEMRIFPF